MPIDIIDVEQGTPEWFQARLGLPTASRFADIMAKGEGKMRRRYLYELAGEILTGEPTESYSNGAMERGKLLEPEARDYYQFVTGHEPQLVGFIKNGAKGCSPDSLLGDAGMLEIKTKLPHLLIEAIVRNEFPPEHRAQCQGALWVAEREWIDIICYWPKMPPFVKRAYRDEAYIATLMVEVARFNEDLFRLVEDIRQPRSEILKNQLVQSLLAG